MNYLAHAYFSFNDPEILAGNLISDFVKGKKKFEYAEGIQRGIALHRKIDEFTDSHPVTQEAKKIFKPSVGLYAGAFMDVVYDHFLALDKNIFPGDSLKEFTAGTYSTLMRYADVFPEPFARMFPHMKEHDWLYNYQYKWGIEKSFGGIVRRAKYLTDSAEAFEAFNDHYELLRGWGEEFLEEVGRYVESSI